MTFSIIVGALAAVAVAISLRDALLTPTFRRLALRNLSRRRGEALLVVIGSMFGTAIIVAAFVVGDSFDGSIRDIARTTLGPIDETVSIRPTNDLSGHLNQLDDRLRHASLPGVDGFLTATTASVVLDNDRTGRLQKIDTSACVAEIDFASARHFGPDAAISGMATAGQSPVGNDIVISRETASRMSLATGDTVTMHLYGATRRLRVRRVLPTVGVAGYCQGMIAAGTLERLFDGSADATAAAGSPSAVQPPAGVVLISNEGGVFDSTGPTDEVTRAVRAATDGRGLGEVEVVAAKRDRLKTAEETGSSLRSIFSGIGGFSVISGILLLINLVVMLAEERKSELGILRAVGMKRNHLWRAFTLEGSMYAAAASILGGASGIGIAALIIAGTQNIFSEESSGFRINLFTSFPTLALGAGIGFAISMITVWIASLRIARLNVIAAIRDLPNPHKRSRHLGQLLLAATGFVVGAGLLISGLGTGAQIPLLIGVPIAAISLLPLARRLVHVLVVDLVLPHLAIAWSLTVFSLFPDKMQHAGMAIFVVMGLILVTSAVIVASTIAPLWPWLLGRTGATGVTLAARLGFAYPLARRVRTALLLGMFSLVIFTMTFLSSFSAVLSTASASAPRDMSAGFDLMIDSSRSNPLTIDTLTARPEVADAAIMVRAVPRFAIRYATTPDNWQTSGIDAAFLAHGTPKLSKRSPSLGSDRAAFEQVLSDPRSIVVDDSFLVNGGGPKTDGPEAGDKVTIVNPAGTRRELTVVGVLASDFTNHGAIWSRAELTSFMAPATVENRAFVRLRPGVDRATAARTLTKAFVDRGAEVSTFRQLVLDGLSRTTSFIRLLEGYLAFGLLIGVAGLGVVMVRAVRERRHEIGMLRAMGFPSRVVQRAFLIEATFIALQGVLIGGGLALVTAYQVVVNSGAFSGQTLHFVIPWNGLAVASIVPLISSIAATIYPARQAGRILPAVALRLAD
jgi:putative ABC transport system permease protein